MYFEMSVFTKNNLEGLKIFVEKPNWKATLNFIQNNVYSHDFFFFFDSERGANLTVFKENITKEDITKIKNYTLTFPATDKKQPEDALFKNFENNSVMKTGWVSENADIEIPDGINNAIHFEKNLSKILIGALNYNDFFIEEKNRINIALQLTFLATVKMNKIKLYDSLPNLLDLSQLDNIDPNLIDFYKEIQEIESEQEVEIWVLDWLELTKNYSTLIEIDFIVQSICQALEIRTFATNILETLIGILLTLKSKSNLQNA